MALRIAALVILLLPSLAGASTVKLKWTHPAFNSTGACFDSLGDADSTKPLLDLYREELIAVRWPQRDSLSLGFIPATGLAGRADSCDVELADSVHYVTFALVAEDGSGNRSCDGNSWLEAIPVRDVQPGLAATYFDNEDLTAQFAKRTDSRIAFTWGTGSALPGMGPDLFSERWTGEINLPVGGLWELSAIVEDGWRAWVGGQFIVSDFGINSVHESRGQFYAEAGWHPLTIEAMHHNGNAEITLSWAPPGGVKVLVPASALRH